MSAFPETSVTKVQRYYHYEGVGGGQMSSNFQQKRIYVTLEWPLDSTCTVVPFDTCRP